MFKGEDSSRIENPTSRTRQIRHIQKSYHHSLTGIQVSMIQRQMGTVSLLWTPEKTNVRNISNIIIVTGERCTTPCGEAIGLHEGWKSKRHHVQEFWSGSEMHERRAPQQHSPQRKAGQCIPNVRPSFEERLIWRNGRSTGCHVGLESSST